MHLHTNRYSACAKATPAELIERLIQTGYEAVYMTEHNTVWSRNEIKQLQQGFPDIQIFPGVELSTGTKKMQHLLILGTTDRAYTEIDNVAEILKKAGEEGHLSVLAHPFRWEGGVEMLDSGLLPDAIEYGTTHHSPEQASVAARTAQGLGLPTVNVGDVHGLDYINRYWIETDKPLIKAGDIRSAVLNRAYVNRTGENE